MEEIEYLLCSFCKTYSSDQRLRQDIILALSDQPSSDDKSHNFRADYSFGSIQGDVIFNDMNTLPKEVTLKTTLNVFDGNYDVFEVNV